jgi:hypothetical protein
MPIYEFYSPDAGKIYSFYARSLAYSDKTPRCPDNPRYRMQKMISSFAALSKRSGSSDAPAAGGDAVEDARMEGMMAQMEREFSGMDENNPDPRQLARMMKSMSAMTGEKMPEPMTEMIERMEKGEDPEKLEAEYGEALEDFGEPGGPAGAEEGAGGAKKRKRSKRAIERDPTLYEMAEYVDTPA